jgi:hypothetical protein
MLVRKQPKHDCCGHNRGDSKPILWPKKPQTHPSGPVEYRSTRPQKQPNQRRDDGFF